MEALRRDDERRIVKAPKAGDRMSTSADQERIKQLLYHEARLMDEHRYTEWLALWDEKGIYWVPSGGAGRDPAKEVSIIYDNRAKLNDRIARFESGDVLAQEPRKPMRRLISNIEVESTGDAELTVLSNFILIIAELHEQAVWAGQSIHKLQERGEGFAILFKKVILVNNDIEMPPLQFLV